MKQTKAKRAVPTVAPLKVVVAVEPTMNSSHNDAPRYALNASCTVRDSIALKSALLDLLADRRPVTIDAGAVERIDTAALQVLCAFARDRKAAGGEVVWTGGTDSFCDAIRLLGLRQLIEVPNARLPGVAR